MMVLLFREKISNALTCINIQGIQKTDTKRDWNHQWISISKAYDCVPNIIIFPLQSFITSSIALTCDSAIFIGYWLCTVIHARVLSGDIAWF